MNCQKCQKSIGENENLCNECKSGDSKKLASGLQIAALVMGILGFFIPFIASILAIIFGAKTIKEKPNGKALAGLILGIITFFGWVPLLIIVLTWINGAK